MEYILQITPALLRGAGVTLGLFAVVLPLSLPLGFLTTLLQRCRFRPLASPILPRPYMRSSRMPPPAAPVRA